VKLTENDIDALQTLRYSSVVLDLSEDESYSSESEARLDAFLKLLLPDFQARMLWAAGVRDRAAFLHATAFHREHAEERGSRLRPERLLFRAIFLLIADELKPSNGGGRGRKGNYALAIDCLNEYLDDGQEGRFGVDIERRPDLIGKHEYRIGDSDRWLSATDLNAPINRALDDIKELASYL
jgi:hypothetical protein